VRWVSQSNSETSAGDLVVLEPEQWLGMPFPISEYIDANLSEGAWIVLFHRHDCPDCQEATPQYERLAHSRRVALVEVPPYGHELVGTGRARHARLRNDRNWFIQTPVEVQLNDGVVVSASTKLPAIAALER
jgi:hypothetical protein